MILTDMAREMHWSSVDAEVWVLGEAAMRELEAEHQRSAAFAVPPPPQGMTYQPSFMGAPVARIRSHHYNQRVELHGRDPMGNPQIKVVRW